MHFSGDDTDDMDVKHHTGVWSEEREEKGNPYMIIMIFSFISKWLQKETALLLSNSPMSSQRASPKLSREIHMLSSFKNPSSAMTRMNLPVHLINSLAFCFCYKNDPPGGHLEWKSHSVS
jgi:hypothetical protein